MIFCVDVGCKKEEEINGDLSITNLRNIAKEGDQKSSRNFVRSSSNQRLKDIDQR